MMNRVRELSEDLADALAEVLRPGAMVAVTDGVGMPLAALAALSRAARTVGGIRLVLGWCPVPITSLELDAFADVVTIMAGYELRAAVDAGQVRYLPARLGAVPALFADVLRPDVVLTSVVRRGDGLQLATEASWIPAAIEVGGTLLVIERPAFPAAARTPPLAPDRVVVIASDPTPPPVVRWGAVSDVHRAIACRVVELVPAGARLQYGPGALGTAVLDTLQRAVRIETGIVTDAVVDLDRRGLLLDMPVAPYLAGSDELYAWADGRPMLDRLEITHDPARLGGTPPLVAVNTALEIDLDGQVNVESVGGSAVAGIGGHPDFAFAAARAPGGLSIVAIPSEHRGGSTLVTQLAAPVSTPSHDVDVVVTERGAADLRGLDRSERRRALEVLWRYG
jgi:acyl-CoA hydrolase